MSNVYEDPCFAGYELVLQQDGAPCHFGLEVRSLLSGLDWEERSSEIATAVTSHDPMWLQLVGYLER